MKQPRFKICCISSIEEAVMAIQAGASALGLVARMPSGPGVITDPEIRKIAQMVPPGVSSFLLTSETDAGDIIDHHHRTRTSALQLVDELKTGSYLQIREALPGIRIVQVIHVEDRSSIEKAKAVNGKVDAILLDSGRPGAEVKVLGGTGLTHDWSLSREIRKSVSVPVFLAGGLNAQNVAAAIAQVQPFGVDLCSGVRTNGRLDAVKLEAFVKALRGKR